MTNKNILIADDEKNIRLTLSMAIEEMGFEPDTAVNGEEALKKIEEKNFCIMLLDIKMPGMDGMQVLKKISESRPDIRVIMITAHGTVDSAVEAMKLGAADFLQKPFTPSEIRDVITRVFNRETLDTERCTEYDTLIELAKQQIGNRKFDAAKEFAHKAAALEPGRPEIFNLLGVLYEIAGNKEDAVKNYRTAYWIDPTYAPSKKNLERITDIHGFAFGIDLGKNPKEK